MIEWKAFPLRPEPDPGVVFKGTYREEGWRRCAAMSEADGIRYTPWPHERLPGWSLPALEAAKCVAHQGPEAFERVHLRLYEAFFTRSVNIADPAAVIEVIRGSGADLARFLADLESGSAREAVLADYREAIARDHVRAIPTVIVEGGQRLTGLADLPAYRKAIESAEHPGP